ncbi:MAG: hypothetical protein HW403_1003 [Dehalococcoidia bacterium]|nr:hypothetical protein [Dehalococcoidia bacterium]
MLRCDDIDKEEVATRSWYGNKKRRASELYVAILIAKAYERYALSYFVRDLHQTVVLHYKVGGMPAKTIVYP